jgi:hypothetical protein
MACEIVDRHIENIDNIFLYLDEIFYNIATMRCFMNMMSYHTVPEAKGINYRLLKKPNKYVI